jgi:hypothetical protein
VRKVSRRMVSWRWEWRFLEGCSGGLGWGRWSWFVCLVVVRVFEMRVDLLGLSLEMLGIEVLYGGLRVG